MPADRGLLDTSIFVARESGRSIDTDGIPRRVAVSVVTLGELRVGVLTARTAQVRTDRLSTFVDAMELAPLPIDTAVAEAWAELRITLRESSRSMSVNASWIAATAMAHGIPVITQDGGFAEGLGFDIVRV